MKKAIFIFLGLVTPVFVLAFSNPIIPSWIDYVMFWSFLFFILVFFTLIFTIVFLSIKRKKIYKGKLNYLLVFVLLIILIILSIQFYESKKMIRDYEACCKKYNQKACFCNPFSL